MSKRLEMLERMVASGKADAFARYALAMEYRSAGRAADALAAFEALRALQPDYLPMYLMAGQLLIDGNEHGPARPWLEQGIALAVRMGDGKARAELEAALATLDE